MRKLFLGEALMVALLLVGSSVSRADPLAPFLNVARPLVVLADSPDDPKFLGQIAALEERGKTIASYDIVVIRVTAPDAEFRRKLDLVTAGFAIVLVGKDGSVKQRWTEPVDPARIFGLVDRMPMRRQEERERR